MNAPNAPAPLQISGQLIEEIIAHCEAGRPNEACGLLGARDGVVVKVFKMANAAASPVRYSLEPKEQFWVYRYLEEQDLDLGGVFHSHTRTEAYPSPTDLRLASEDVPYVIVSLAQEPATIRAFRIVKETWDADEADILEVPIVVTSGLA